jgi:hypothetical protein
LQYTPTHDCPHPYCHAIHGVHRVLATFILVRLITAGWYTFLFFAVLGTVMAVRASEPVHWSCHTRPLVIRWGWLRGAFLMDHLLLGVQCAVGARLMQSVHELGANVANVTTWILIGVNVVLNETITRVHHKATFHPEPEEVEDA